MWSSQYPFHRYGNTRPGHVRRACDPPINPTSNGIARFLVWSRRQWAWHTDFEP